jgi:glycosyltransferase involved in cell wall biosynthesis
MENLAIVPAYNEEESVGQVVSSIHRHAPDFDVLVVDDGSTDATAERAAAAGATVIRHPFNAGIGAAVQSGYRHALRNGHVVAVQVDGDGQHDPAYIGRLAAELNPEGDGEIVWGSRFLEGAGYRVPRGRRIGIAIFARLLSWITGSKVTDPTSGFRMTNRRGIELFARDYPHDYPEVEALLMMHAHRLRLHEVPVSMVARQAGRSSITHGQSAYYMGRVLLAILVGLFRRTRSIESNAALGAERGV